ncbi:hypothetical protein JQX13_29000 [Archangium violaceum]|uniref:hypothetical protein n=1 Tax=Archangium violaceum TaxID=83451 RepID=UPI00193B9A28|nr:hypothetical protein [Archangium violaceum]QRK04302.1 hypothetical protein JQX13_29000 [Archangium violaceum]
MRGPFLVAVLLLLAPTVTRADGESGAPSRYTQVDEGYVRIVDVSGRMSLSRNHSRGPFKPIYEQAIKVDNHLDLELFDVSLELGYLTLDSTTHVVRREHYMQIFNARGPTTVHFIYAPPLPALEERPTAALVRYRVAASPARTQGLTRTLLMLSNSKGRVDLAVAAEILPELGPDATLVREEVRKWVAGGPLGIAEAFGQGITPLYALRLLGRVGTGEDVPLLLSVLESGPDYSWYWPSLEALREALPDHPMTNLFASGATLEHVVEDAVRDLQPALAVPALVTVAYREGPQRNAARALLRKWTTEELVDVLRGPAAAETLRVLCASRTPDALPLVLGLGVTRVEGVDLRMCLSAMPEKETNVALVGALGEELGPLEDAVLSLLVARSGVVRAPLRARASKLGLRGDAADTGALARAIHEHLRSERMGALQATLDAVDAAVRDELFDSALALLGKAAKEARGREQRAKLAVAHARFAQVATRARNLDMVDRALEGIEVPRSGHEHEADLDPELTELARLLLSNWRDRYVDMQLARIEARVGEATRPELARIYMASIDGHPRSIRVAYAERALALEPGNTAARHLIEEDARARARDAHFRSLAIGAGWLLLVGLVVWFIVSRPRAAV